MHEVACAWSLAARAVGLMFLGKALMALAVLAVVLAAVVALMAL